LKQIYITSREFGGWSYPPSGTDYREPVAFEEGFPVKRFHEKISSLDANEYRRSSRGWMKVQP